MGDPVGVPYFWRRSVLSFGTLVVAALKLLALVRGYGPAGRGSMWFETREWTLSVVAAEVFVAFLLLTRRWKVASAASLCGVVSAVAFVSYLHVSRIGVERCGCFGLVRLGLGAHLLTAAAFGMLALSCLLAPESKSYRSASEKAGEASSP